MSSSAIASYSGTSLINGGGFKWDLSKLKPGDLISGDDSLMPTQKDRDAEGATPLGQKMRADMLQTMGLSESDLSQLQTDTRTDVENQMARNIHEAVLASGNTSPGQLANFKV